MALAMPLISRAAILLLNGDDHSDNQKNTRINRYASCTLIIYKQFDLPFNLNHANVLDIQKFILPHQ